MAHERVHFTEVEHFEPNLKQEDSQVVRSSLDDINQSLDCETPLQSNVTVRIDSLYTSPLSTNSSPASQTIVEKPSTDNSQSTSSSKRFRRRLDMKSLPRRKSHSQRWGEQQEIEKAQSRLSFATVRQSQEVQVKENPEPREVRSLDHLERGERELDVKEKKGQTEEEPALLFQLPDGPEEQIPNARLNHESRWEGRDTDVESHDVVEAWDEYCDSDANSTSSQIFHEKILREAHERLVEIKQEGVEWNSIQLRQTRQTMLEITDDESESLSEILPLPDRTKQIMLQKSNDLGYIQDLLSKKYDFLQPLEVLSDSNLGEESVASHEIEGEQLMQHPQMLRPETPSVSIGSDESWNETPSPRSGRAFSNVKLLAMAEESPDSVLFSDSLDSRLSAPPQISQLEPNHSNEHKGGSSSTDHIACSKSLFQDTDIDHDTTEVINDKQILDTADIADIVYEMDEEGHEEDQGFASSSQGSEEESNLVRSLNTYSGSKRSMCSRARGLDMGDSSLGDNVQISYKSPHRIQQEQDDQNDLSPHTFVMGGSSRSSVTSRRSWQESYRSSEANEESEPSNSESEDILEQETKLSVNIDEYQSLARESTVESSGKNARGLVTNSIHSVSVHHSIDESEGCQPTGRSGRGDLGSISRSIQDGNHSFDRDRYTELNHRWSAQTSSVYSNLSAPSLSPSSSVGRERVLVAPPETSDTFKSPVNQQDFSGKRDSTLPGSALSRKCKQSAPISFESTSLDREDDQSGIIAKDIVGVVAVTGVVASDSHQRGNMMKQQPEACARELWGNHVMTMSSEVVLLSHSVSLQSPDSLESQENKQVELNTGDVADVTATSSVTANSILYEGDYRSLEQDYPMVQQPNIPDDVISESSAVVLPSLCLKEGYTMEEQPETAIYGLASTEEHGQTRYISQQSLDCINCEGSNQEAMKTVDVADVTTKAGHTGDYLEATLTPSRDDVMSASSEECAHTDTSMKSKQVLDSDEHDQYRMNAKDSIGAQQSSVSASEQWGDDAMSAASEEVLQSHPAFQQSQDFLDSEKDDQAEVEAEDVAGVAVVAAVTTNAIVDEADVPILQQSYTMAQQAETSTHEQWGDDAMSAGSEAVLQSRCASPQSQDFLDSEDDIQVEINAGAIAGIERSYTMAQQADTPTLEQFEDDAMLVNSEVVLPIHSTTPKSLNGEHDHESLNAKDTTAVFTAHASDDDGDACNFRSIYDNEQQREAALREQRGDDSRSASSNTSTSFGGENNQEESSSESSDGIVNSNLAGIGQRWDNTPKPDSSKEFIASSKKIEVAVGPVEQAYGKYDDFDDPSRDSFAAAAAAIKAFKEYSDSSDGENSSSDFSSAKGVSPGAGSIKIDRRTESSRKKFSESVRDMFQSRKEPTVNRNETLISKVKDEEHGPLQSIAKVDKKLENKTRQNSFSGLRSTSSMTLQKEYYSEENEASERLFSVIDEGGSNSGNSAQQGIQRKWLQRYCYLCCIITLLLVIILPAVLLTRKSGSSQRMSLTPSSASFVPSSAPTVPLPKKEWIQVGGVLTGKDSRDQAGFAVSLSDDGTILAVGARRDSRDNERNRGAVQIYSLESTRGIFFWNRIAELVGNASGDQFGFSVSLSADGQRIAIGSIGSDAAGSNSGLVQIFETTLDEWVLISSLYGEQENDIFGTSVSLSKNGSILAVGAPYHSSNGFIRGGKVYFYQNIRNNGQSVWNVMGESISGRATEDLFGWSVSLSQDGLQVAIGAPLELSRAQESGYVRVFDFDSESDSWKAIGVSIDGDDPKDRFGYSLSLSNDGKRLAIGAYGARDDAGTEVGKVSVYNRNGDLWQKSKKIFGETKTGRFGLSVSLSGDGNILAIGAPTTLNEGGKGKVGTYDLSSSSSFAATDILPDDDSEDSSNLGFSVCLATKGRTLAVGAPGANAAIVYSWNK